MSRVYEAIASALEAMLNCENSGNTEWHGKHKARILRIVRECLPSGSGFDSGCEIDLDKSVPDRLVFTTSFHHMNDTGYVGWSHERVIVTPSLAHTINVRVVVTGRHYRADSDWRDYAHECFDTAMRAECPDHVMWDMTLREWQEHCDRPTLSKERRNV